MRPVRLRHPALAVTTACLALLVTACGGEQKGTEPGGAAGPAKASATATASAAPTAAATMRTDEHFASLVTQDDLPRYRGFGNLDVDMLPATALAVDKPACKPIADALFAVPTDARGSLRQVLRPEPGTATTEVAVGTYEGTKAQEWLTALKAAVAPCANGFTATQATDLIKYTQVKPEPLSAGDEALAWSVTVEKRGVPMPVRLAVVRKRNNVAVFSTYDAKGGTVDRQPKDLIDAQTAKLP
ncbi:hypothetical protein AB0M38_22930 [Streptomyces sp. NPDC051742]|uniref:hypothetical protein n=1 Tax=unclassified Streptomyces TaxID=2593676 RepID=UPI003422303C